MAEVDSYECPVSGCDKESSSPRGLWSHVSMTNDVEHSEYKETHSYEAFKDAVTPDEDSGPSDGSQEDSDESGGDTGGDDATPSDGDTDTQTDSSGSSTPDYEDRLNNLKDNNGNDVEDDSDDTSSDEFTLPFPKKYLVYGILGYGALKLLSGDRQRQTAQEAMTEPEQIQTETSPPPTETETSEPSETDETDETVADTEEGEYEYEPVARGEGGF